MTWLHYNLKAIAIVGMLLAVLGKGNAQVAPITINPDNSVTITYIAPEADDVQVQGTFFRKGSSIVPMAGIFLKDGKAKMKSQGDGVWSYTSKPLESELYWYDFVIDEDSVRYDQRNSDTTRDIETIYNYFIIRGGIADDYVYEGNQPGHVDYVWYPSTLNGMERRRMAVYLPYGYDQNQQTHYPVLYLLHGSGGDETSWADCGRLAQIMDNLIEQGRCQPMIVVMPNGNVDLAAAPGDDPKNPDAKPSSNNVTSMIGKIEKAFYREVVSFTDKNYRTIADKQHRAIAGLSLGGLQTLFTALNNPESFDYVGLFSAQTTNALNDKYIGNIKQLAEGWDNLKSNIPFLSGTKVDEKITGLVGTPDSHFEIYENLDEKLANYFSQSPQLFYIAVGKDDFTKKLNDDLRKKLNKGDYAYVYNETDGAHTWANWRKYLVDFLPRLFNPQQI